MNVQTLFIHFMLCSVLALVIMNGDVNSVGLQSDVPEFVGLEVDDSDLPISKPSVKPSTTPFRHFSQFSTLLVGFQSTIYRGFPVLPQAPPVLT